MTTAAPRLLALAMSADASGTAGARRFFQADTQSPGGPDRHRHGFKDSTADGHRQWTQVSPGVGGTPGD